MRVSYPLRVSPPPLLLRCAISFPPPPPPPGGGGGVSPAPPAGVPLPPHGGGAQLVLDDDVPWHGVHLALPVLARAENMTHMAAWNALERVAALIVIFF